MLGGLGPTELIVVLVIILVVFGAGKLPDIASGLGKGLRDFKKVMEDPDAPDAVEPPKGPPEETPPSGKNPEDA